VDAQQFTVPSYVTGVMPAGSGMVTLANYTNYKTFTASGLDFATSVGYVAFSANATFQ
jgi:hypothetical protein